MATLTVILTLILVNALFVAAEFASVAVRKVRVESRAESGDGRARLLLTHIGDARAMGHLVSASQIGITAASLFLGAYGQSSLAGQFDPWLRQLTGLPAPASRAASVAIVLVSLTVVQVIFGELVPKTVAMRFPDQVALSLIYPFSTFMRAFSWLIEALFLTGSFFLRLLHVPVTYHRHVHSPEEIELLLVKGRERGSIDAEEHKRLRRVLRFAERRVREVMVPRTRMVTLSKSAGAQTILETVANSAFTRIPVYAETPDDIVGIVHVKDLAIAVAAGGEISLERLLRPVPRVPPAMPMDEVLEVMRAQRAQMAIVLDEYGGTAGLVTMENLVEEVLGEMQDEFDREAPLFASLGEREAVVRGDLSLGDLADHTGLLIEDEDVHSVGGLVMKLLGRPPRVGDAVDYHDHNFAVEDVRGPRIQRVRVHWRGPLEAQGSLEAVPTDNEGLLASGEDA